MLVNNKFPNRLVDIQFRKFLSKKRHDHIRNDSSGCIHSSPSSARISDEDSAPQLRGDPVHVAGGGTSQHSGGCSDSHQESSSNDAPATSNGTPDPINDVSEPNNHSSSITQMSDQQHDIIKLFYHTLMTTNYEREENNLMRIIRSNIQPIDSTKQEQILIY